MAKDRGFGSTLTIVAIGVLIVVAINNRFSGDPAAPPRSEEQHLGSLDPEPAARPTAGEQYYYLDGADYRLIEHRKNDAGNIVALTSRWGRSGVNYALREYRCDRNDFRYIAEGDSVEEVKSKPDQNQPFGPLVAGSSSSKLGTFVCSKY